MQVIPVDRDDEADQRQAHVYAAVGADRSAALPPPPKATRVRSKAQKKKMMGKMQVNGYRLYKPLTGGSGA